MDSKGEWSDHMVMRTRGEITGPAAGAAAADGTASAAAISTSSP